MNSMLTRLATSLLLVLIIFLIIYLFDLQSREIIKKDSSIKKNDFVVITAGLPFGNSGMTNMIRLYKVGS